MSRNRVISLVIACVAVTAALAGQTKGTDPVPDFNLEYFVGTWTFEWTAPDSPLGPGGDHAGTQTFMMLKPPVTFARTSGVPAVPAGLIPAKFLSHPALDGRREGTGPSGAITSRVIIGFDPSSKEAVQVEIPSKGAPIVRTGTIGGDLGLTYSFFWETPAVRKGRQSVQIAGRTMITSPNAFRDQIQYSVDGGARRMLGQPWYERKEK